MWKKTGKMFEIKEIIDRKTPVRLKKVKIDFLKIKGFDIWRPHSEMGDLIEKKKLKNLWGSESGRNDSKIRENLNLTGGQERSFTLTESAHFSNSLSRAKFEKTIKVKWDERMELSTANGGQYFEKVWTKKINCELEDSDNKIYFLYFYLWGVTVATLKLRIHLQTICSWTGLQTRCLCN